MNDVGGSGKDVQNHRVTGEGRLTLRPQRESLGGEQEVFDMSQTGDTQSPAQTREEKEHEALERYYERRIAEIRRGKPLSQDGLIPLEKLQELADGSPSGDSSARPG